MNKRGWGLALFDIQNVMMGMQIYSRIIRINGKVLIVPRLPESCLIVKER